MMTIKAILTLSVILILILILTLMLILADADSSDSGVLTLPDTERQRQPCCYPSVTFTRCKGKQRLPLLLPAFVYRLHTTPSEVLMLQRPVRVWVADPVMSSRPQSVIDKCRSLK